MDLANATRRLTPVAALTAALCACAVFTAPAEAAPPRPNVVLIQFDDQPLSMFTEEVMPNVFDRIAEPGSEFRNYFTVAPTCCPSRATLLTGQYPHNHGVLSNTPGYAMLREPANMLPAWLKRAGYETAHVGKYLNNYGKVAGNRAVPAGWEHWVGALEPRRYYDYDLFVNGRKVHRGKRPGDHLARVLNRKATSLAGRLARRRAPFFLSLDHYSPHKGAGDAGGRCAGAAVPEVRDLERFQNAPLPQNSLPPDSRSLNEADVSDKPPFVASQPALPGKEINRIERRWGCALAASYSADRGIENVYQAVRKANELSRTVFIYTSDNGFFYGEHRVATDKQLPYEEVIRQPFAIRIPDAYRKGNAEPKPGAMAANIDVAPTVLDLARARPCLGKSRCRTLDGRSLLGPASGSTKGFADRALLVEFDLGKKRSRERIACKFKAVRTKTDMYARYQQVVVEPDSEKRLCRRSLQVEHYDLGSDPLQLDSLWAGTEAETPEQRALRTELKRLARCKGSGRRAASGHAPCD